MPYRSTSSAATILVRSGRLQRLSTDDPCMYAERLNHFPTALLSISFYQGTRYPHLDLHRLFPLLGDTGPVQQHRHHIIGIIGAGGLHQQRIHLGQHLLANARLRLRRIPSPHLVIVPIPCCFTRPGTRLLGIHMEHHDRAGPSHLHHDPDCSVSTGRHRLHRY